MQRDLKFNLLCKDVTSTLRRTYFTILKSSHRSLTNTRENPRSN